jgi:nucleotide-binding universal stress UspA family protein
MTIVCGTDFSEQAAHAVNVAAALSAALSEELKIIYAFDKKSSEQILASAEEVVLATIRQRLGNEVERARHVAASAAGEILTGAPDEVLAEAAGRSGATLLIVSATGSRSASFWTLGSVAERTARTAPCPTLVVRDSEPLVRWIRGERPLRVIVGIDASAASDAGVVWLQGLRKAGPFDVSFVHVYSPVTEAARLGLPTTPIPGEGSEVERRLHGELLERLRGLGEPEPRLILQMNLGRSADPLVILAEEHGADLLVVGSNRRTGIERAKHGSVSYTALHLAKMSVVSVPVHSAAPQRGTAGPKRHVILAIRSLDEVPSLLRQAAPLIGPGAAVLALVARGTDRAAVEHAVQAGAVGAKAIVEEAPADLLEAVLDRARELEADLICASARDAERLLKSSPVPVLAVQTNGS